jgi:hypothetical protein
MDAIHRFELEDLQLMEIESDVSSSTVVPAKGAENGFDDVDNDAS